MPTVKIDISTGAEYSPTDGIDSSVKLHNYIVGKDGSIYKIPALKNLKNTKEMSWPPGAGTPPNPLIWPFRILDFKKYQTSGTQNIGDRLPVPTDAVDPINDTPQETKPNYFVESKLFNRYIYLTNGSYGIINIDYDGNRLDNATEFPSDSFLWDFEKEVFQFKMGSFYQKPFIDMASLHSKIIVDFNSQKGESSSTHGLKCIFPSRWMFQPMSDNVAPDPLYSTQLPPRNMVSCSMFMQNPTPGPDVQPLYLEGNDNIKREYNDIARGPVLIGNRMIFYSAIDNAFYFSTANKFSELMNKDASTFRVTVPPFEIQSIAEFNGNIIAFTPSGMTRWVLSPDADLLIQQDPTFNYDHRIRYEGSFVNANRSLYFYTDDHQVYRLNSNLTVNAVFDGTLPTYKPLQDYLVTDHDLPMSYFKMLGMRFVSIGPWLYNIDTNTWSTYSFDGWKNPLFPTENYGTMWANDTAKQTISTAFDNIICTHSTICRPLSYEEMHDPTIFDDTEPSLEVDKHQWGEVSFFTTRMYQDERQFSIDGVTLYVRGGLELDTKMYMQILRGSDQGSFDMDDETTWGIPAIYRPAQSSTTFENNNNYVGSFVFPRANLKTNRFRLQFITKTKQAHVIEAPLVNITTSSDSQAALVEPQVKPKEQKKR